MLDKTLILNGNSKVEKARKIHAELNGQHPEVDHILNQIFRIVDEPLTVAVMGEFSAGKSSFLNKLLHIDALPVSVLPKTATLTRLVYGTTPAVEIEYDFGGERVIQRKEGYEAFKELQSASKIRDPLFLQELERIQEVRVYIDIPKLKTFELLDTPGFNHDAAMDAKSLQALENTDLVIWISDYTQAAKKTEFEKLQYIKGRVGRLHLVINKGDIHVSDSESYHKAQQELSDSLAANGFLDFFQTENVHLISSKPSKVQPKVTEETLPPPPTLNWSNIVTIVRSWLGKPSKNQQQPKALNSLLSSDPFWDGIFEQFVGNFGASVLNADLTLSVSLIDDQWKYLEAAIQNETLIYRTLLDTVAGVQERRNVDNLADRNWQELCDTIHASLLRVKSTLLHHCKSSGELCNSGVLSVSALALEFTKAALHEDFCELKLDYMKHLALLDKRYCSVLHADLQTIAESIPQQHQPLIETVTSLVSFYKLRADVSSIPNKCNLSATSRTLELLDHSGVQFWSQNANRFSINWKQAILDTMCDSNGALVTDMSFDDYVWLQLNNSFFEDFQSDMCRLASDPVVHGFIEEARRVLQKEIVGLTTASEVAG